jgi:hypothetical protein
VVPYNPYLSLRYGCHINVEACVNVDSIKYLYKYAYKGADRTTAMLHGTAVDSNAHPAARDEIREWLDSRYISACEAAWHLLGFSVHNEAPAVMRLSVHLPLRQTVTFQPEADLQHVSERAQHIHHAHRVVRVQQGRSPALRGGRRHRHSTRHPRVPQHTLR